MPGRSLATDLASMRAALVAGLGQPAAIIETPLIGRVEFRTVDEIQAAIAWVDSQNPATAATPRTFVMQSNRGTGGCL